MSTQGQCPHCGALNDQRLIACLNCNARLPWADALSAGLPPAQTPVAPPIPAPGAPVYHPLNAVSLGNNSGMGAQSVLPNELRGFNWGALIMNWIWAIGHSTWLGLLVFVPYIGFIVAIVLGFKGNEWAWQNRKWVSIEEFKATQRIWMMWGVGLTVLGILSLVFLGILGSHVGGNAGRPVSPVRP